MSIPTLPTDNHVKASTTMSATRLCANPFCKAEITKSDGGVKAGDMIELMEGKRKPEDVRELCGQCALVCRWSDGSRLLIPADLYSPLISKQQKVVDALNGFANALIFQEGIEDLEVQDAAEKHGLIELKIINEPCDSGEFSSCVCAEVMGEPPYECYRRTELWEALKQVGQ